MKARATLFIAFRYLIGKRGGGRYLIGAVAGIALSLVPIMVTLIVADGMIRGITDRFLELGTGHIQVWENVRGLDANRLSLDDAKETVAQNEHVRGVWTEKQGIGIILGFEGRTGVTIRAVESGFWQDEGSARYLEVIDGEAAIERDNEALLGKSLAETAGVNVGDTIRVMTVRETSDGRAIPRTSLFAVKGIVSSGYHELDSLWCIINYAAGTRILDDALSYSCLLVKVDTPYQNVAAIARDLLADLHFGFGVYTWRELQAAQYASYESTRQLLLFIMTLIVLIAAVNVSSATSMLTIERYRDIAILKAGGMSPREISAIFVIAGLLTGLAGTIVGISVGLLIGRFINPLIHGLERLLSVFSRLFSGTDIKILDPGFYLENIPVVIDRNTVLIIALFAILSAAAAALFPALRAGKQKPVSLLRKI
ncbi:MAG: FtsX-like permease family protein [Spirochaetaceae bacterium]|nr:FtsX-like permease family protein [Spirochaetaceae bacterium]